MGTDSADRPVNPAPLAGVRILAVEQYGAGPLGTMFLADLGAEIVKIEDPHVGGDISRYIPPGQQGTDSLFFEAFNRGKRSLVLDLKNGSGRAVFESLVSTADAVFSNLRGDQPTRLGLTYESLGRFNRAIVCVALTGYGRTGPAAGHAAYDALIQAEAGWASLTGDPGDPPTKSGLSLADYIAGLTSVIGLLAGVMDARRTGVGRDIDANLYDSALAMLTYPATWMLSAGYLTSRLPMSAHPSVVPFQFFATSDGYLAIACPKEKFFRSLCTRLNLPELTERFADFDMRRERREELLTILASRFATQTTESWLELLRSVVPIAPVRSLEEALTVAELAQRGMLAAYPHPTFGEVRSIGLPLAVDGYAPTYRRAPELGADGLAILSELGYDHSAIAELATQGAFGVAAASPEGNP